ncbi:hypothetical protein AcW1_001998 [Taiwanofungus camphoratus]|nr:hypothetical protein AcV5_009996 [Antrodia cinnamomea]KAI0944243.1 hypothetical protein AcW1_001998 [Antrodia cinnamomea]
MRKLLYSFQEERSSLLEHGPGALQQGWQWLVSVLYVILACGNVQRYSSEDAIAEARGPFWAAAQDVDDEGIDGVVHGRWADVRTDMN